MLLTGAAATDTASPLVPVFLTEQEVLKEALRDHTSSTASWTLLDASTAAGTVDCPVHWPPEPMASEAAAGPTPGGAKGIAVD